jgi:polysaccharide pyruvyl transferase WcaK-like protein
MGSVLRFGKYSSRDGYFEEFLNSVSKNIQKKDHVFLFSSVNDDYDEMKNLFGYLSKKIENKISVIPIGDEDTLLENLGRARVVISSRMHPLIFAHILGARPVAIDASEKIKSFSENFLSLSPQDLKEELRASIDQLGVV